MGASYIVTIHNSHTANITVDRATGANTIDGIAADVNLPPGQSVTFVTNSTPNGYFSDINAIQGFGFGSAYSETAVSVAATGTVDLNLRNGTYFYTGDMSSNTVTFTFSNPVVTGRVSSFTLEMTDAGDATAINWPASVVWPNADTEPTWTTSGVDFVSFVTRDGGTTWRGFAGGFDF